MRNLKKALSLVLAMVMLLGMMVVGAGATEFRDDSSIEYKEAADVLSEIGVIAGRDDNSFDPKGNLRRAEGAAIIYRMLTGGVSTNPAGGATGFVDVDNDPAYAWATGIIADLAGKGIVSGLDSTHFAPGDYLTGVAFGKMLLVALGYNAEYQGYVGGGWDGNVIRDCYSKGLSVTGVNMAGLITREQAAQMALNTLEADMVYQKGGIQIGDVVLPGDRPEDVTNTSSDYQNRPIGTGANQDNKMQFCETYFPSLKKTSEGEDDFKNAQMAWKYGRTTIGTYASAVADTTYENQAVTYKTLRKDFGTKAKFVIYTDGVLSPYTTKGSAEDYKTLTDTDTSVAGLGSTVKVYDMGPDASPSANPQYRVVVTNTYMGTVGSLVSATSTRKAAINVTGTSVKGGGRFETTEEYTVGDYVLYTYANNKVQSVKPAETVTGNLTRFTSSKVTVDGAAYDYSNKWVNQAASAMRGKDVELVLDDFGNILNVSLAEAAAAQEYALLLETGTSGLTKVALVVMPDGSTEEITLKRGTTLSVASDSAPHLVTFSESDGVYTLTDKGAATSKSGQVKIIEAGKSALTGFTGLSAANNNTLFFVRTGTDSYKVYKGIKEVPGLTINSGKSALIAADGENGMAKAVYVDASNADNVDRTDATASAQIFVLGQTGGKVTDSVKGEYYVYPAIVDGEYVEEFETKTQVTTPALYANVSYDENDVATLSGTPDTNGETGITKANNGSIKIGSTDYWTYADDIQVFYIDGKTMVGYGIGAVENDSNDKVWVVGDTNKLTAKAIVIKSNAGGEDVKGDSTNALFPSGTTSAEVNNVGKDAVIVVPNDGALTVKGNVEKNADITIKSLTGIVAGDDATFDEAVKLDKDATISGNIKTLPKNVPVYIEDASKYSLSGTTDVSADTIVINYTREQSKKVTLTITKEGANTAAYKEELDSPGSDSGIFYVSLSATTDAGSKASGPAVTDGKFAAGYYTVTVEQDGNVLTSFGFTWAGK